MTSMLMRNGAVSFKTRENICFVIESSESSMDRYLTLNRQKTPKGPRTEWLRDLLKEHKKVFIWGKSGIGKTWAAKSITLDGTFEMYDDDDDFSKPSDAKYVLYIGNLKNQCPEDVPCFEFSPWTDDELEKWLGRKKLNTLEGTRDIFEEPYEIAERLLKKTGDFNVPDIAERGFMFAMVHENHGSMNPEIYESLSNASIFDTYVYKNSDWTLTPYFVNEGIIRPCCLMDEPVNELRPGSLWTKHQNMCMKKKRLAALYLKGFTLEYLPLLRDYLNVGIIHPSLESSDIDIINHVCKIKKIHLLKRRLKGGK